MILDRKPFIFVWRPFYRFVFAPLILPYLVAFRSFFLADTREKLSEMTAAVFALQRRCENHERSLDEVRAAIQSFAFTMERTETATARQWAEIEKLLLVHLSEAKRD